MTHDRWAIDVDRDDIAQAELVDLPPVSLDDGEIEVAIDIYAMTANNVTYAVFGKPSGLFGNDKGYWDFFADRDRPGRLPVWGFTTVTESRAQGVEAGDIFYGYYPMASHAVLRPSRVGRRDLPMPRRAAATCRSFIISISRSSACPVITRPTAPFGRSFVRSS